jgi:uncharacterized protein (DUF1778 family)
MDDDKDIIFLSQEDYDWLMELLEAPVKRLESVERLMQRVAPWEEETE